MAGSMPPPHRFQQFAFRLSMALAIVVSVAGALVVSSWLLAISGLRVPVPGAPDTSIFGGLMLPLAGVATVSATMDDPVLALLAYEMANILPQAGVCYLVLKVTHRLNKKRSPSGKCSDRASKKRVRTGSPPFQ